MAAILLGLAVLISSDYRPLMSEDDTPPHLRADYVPCNCLLDEDD